MSAFNGKPLRLHELAVAFEPAEAVREGSVSRSDDTVRNSAGLDQLPELTAGDEALAPLPSFEFVVGALGLLDEFEAAHVEGRAARCGGWRTC